MSSFLDIIKTNLDKFKDLTDDIIEIALKEGIISKDEFESLCNMAGEEEVIDLFLKMIMNRKDPEQIVLFVESLKKYYYWLYRLFQKEPKRPRNDNFINSLNIGGVPPLPLRNVTRNNLIAVVRTKLEGLEQGQYLILHGMGGSGKTCLAAEALRDKNIIENCFNNNVFWLTIGSERSDFAAFLHELNSMLPEPYQNLSRDITEARNQLKKKWQEEKMRMSLLILDDVPLREDFDVIEIFNFNCKTMLTAKDRNLTRKFSSVAQFVKVTESFTEKETLELFSKSIGVDPPELPKEAKELHKAAKGFPMTLSLIAGQFEENKESVKTDKTRRRWKHCIDKIKDGDYRFFTNSNLDGKYNAFTTIENTILNLTPEQKAFYKDFAVFQEDVNISREVLSVLWSKDVFDVESCMILFEHKSLIVRRWNEQLNCYVYGIHDILLKYIREKLSSEEIKELNLKLVTKYAEKCKNDFAKLPNDNYIFIYIGHHLKNAGLISWFPKIYFDLEFIEAKLQAVGPTDLLEDFKKYRNEIIAENPQNEEELQEIIEFVECFGQLIHDKRGVNIIQCALQEGNETSVFKKGLELACKHKNEPYINFVLNPGEKKVKPDHLLVPENKTVSVISCTDNPDMILVGFVSGLIELWSIKERRQKKMFLGNKGKVTKFSFTSLGSKFLSTSLDGYVRIWNFSEDTGYIFCYDDLDCPRTPSPGQRQESYSPMFSPGNSEYIDESFKQLRHGAPVLCGVFGKISDRIVSCSSKVLKIWSEDGKGKHVLKAEPNSSFTSCIFFKKDSLVLVATGDYKMLAYDKDTLVMQKVMECPIININVFPDDDSEIVILTKEFLSVWSYAQENGNGTKENVIKVVSQIPSWKKERYTCCDAGKHVYAGSSAFSINIIDRENGKLIKNLDRLNGKVKCLGMDVLEKDSEVKLFTVHSDNSICRWHLENIITHGPLLMPKFSCCWLEEYPIIAAPTTTAMSKRYLQVVEGQTILLMKPCEVQCLHLCSDGKRLVYLSEIGEVFLMDISSLKMNEVKVMSMNIEMNNSIVRVFPYKNQYIVTASTQGSSLQIWFNCDLNCCSFTGIGANDWIYEIFFFNSQIISITANKGIEIWDVSGELVDTWSNRADWCVVKDCTLSSRTGELVIVDNSHAVTIYSILEKGVKTIKTESLPSVCAFSPDGSLIALVLTDGYVIILDSERDKLKKVNLQETDISSVSICNSGEVCIATRSGFVLMVMRDNQVARAQLLAWHIVASPKEPRFATVGVTSGVVHLMEPLDRDTRRPRLKLGAFSKTSEFT